MESLAGWSSVFEELKRGAVGEVGWVVSDGLSHIEGGVFTHFPKAQLQLCVVHLERNVLKWVRPWDREAVVADFCEVLRTQDSRYTREEAQSVWQQFTKKWGRYYAGVKRIRGVLLGLHAAILLLGNVDMTRKACEGKVPKTEL